MPHGIASPKSGHHFTKASLSDSSGATRRSNRTTEKHTIDSIHGPFQRYPMRDFFWHPRKKPAGFTPKPSIFHQGNNFNKRLGHGDGPNLAAPKRVDALAGEHVIMSVAWLSLSGCCSRHIVGEKHMEKS